jgi:hypothetical protein
VWSDEVRGWSMQVSGASYKTVVAQTDVEHMVSSQCGGRGHSPAPVEPTIAVVVPAGTVKVMPFKPYRSVWTKESKT